MPTQKIIQGVRKFQAEVYPDHKQLFAELEHGQKPEVLLITCSDSRIDPAIVTQTLPGDLFVLRNAGNLVGRYEPDGDAQAGAIEYAIKALGVQHVVVCGHLHCGAMAAVLDPDSARGLPAVQAWLRKAGPGQAPGSEPTLADQVRFNVVTQIENLRTHPAVRKAEGDGELALHGWVYDFVTGEIMMLRAERGEFVPFEAAGEKIAV